MFARIAVCSMCWLVLLLGVHGCTQGDSSNQDPPDREGTPDGGIVDALCTAPPDPAPPAPTDVASRLVSANAEAQRLQCDCAVDFSAYACVDNCEADLFKLEPNGDVQCLRDLLGSTLDAPTVECQLAAIESLNACIPGAECSDDAFDACLIPFEIALLSCPPAAQGFEALADGCFDRTGNELVDLYTASLDAAFDEACRCVASDEEREECLALKQAPRVDCLTLLMELDPLPRAVTECLIEYLDEEAELLADEACCESPDDFDCRTGPFLFSGELNPFGSPRGRISGALGNCLGSEQNRIVYTATGTLSDAMGGDAARLEDATLTIRVQADPDASPTPLSSGTSERAVWNAAASYAITGRPNGAPDLTFAASTGLVAVNRFPIDPDAPQLPGGPPDSFGFESTNGLLEGVAVGLPFVQADFPGHELFSDRETPAIRSLPSYQEALSGGSLADATGSGAFSYDFDVQRFRGDPVPVFDAADAVVFCMGPEPALPFDPLNDAGRCGDEEALLVSGGIDDFMAVSRSAAQALDGAPYLYYLVVRRDQISELQTYVRSNPLLAELDPVRSLVSALETFDDSEDDNCRDGGGVISVALPPEAGTPPDLSEVATRIEEAQRALGQLRMLDLQALKEQAVQIVLDTVRQAICPTIGVAVNKVIAPTNFKRLALNIALRGVLGTATGCIEGFIE
jgi:hypothetical protein